MGWSTGGRVSIQKCRLKLPGDDVLFTRRRDLGTAGRCVLATYVKKDWDETKRKFQHVKLSRRNGRTKKSGDRAHVPTSEGGGQGPMVEGVTLSGLDITLTPARESRGD